MNRLFLVLFFALQAGQSNSQTFKPSDLPHFIVLVRHAEFEAEPPGNPHLSAAGKKRAQDLAFALSGTRFSVIITTQLFRTRETAQPIAEALGLTPEVVELTPGQATAYENGVLAALSKHGGKSVLVVSHSRSGPAIITGLGGPRLLAICESVHDDLFVAVPMPDKVQVVQSRYGEVSTTRGPDCK